MSRVVILQQILPHYRIPFFHRLKDRLDAAGIALELIYGQEAPGAVPVTTPFDAPWAHRVTNRYLRLPSAELVWQPTLGLARQADLIVLEHAARMIRNYPLLFGPSRPRGKLAFWDHGRNMQAAGGKKWRESIKRRLTGHVDWWFAYTEVSAKIVAATGFPRERISVVQNTIDTTALQSAMSAVDAAHIEKLRQELGIAGDNVCLYCGEMYPDKKLGFLVAACMRLRARLPDLHVIFIGAGPDQRIVENAARDHPWIHYVGRKTGAARAPYFALSRALLMPGLVGLVIIDSFVAGVPMFTTDVPIHSPEIAYLEQGVNAIMTSHTIAAYVDALAGYLESPRMQDRLKRGCRDGAARYTLDAMAENFAAGVRACLAQPST